MNRLVQGDDGREWIVRAQLEWRPPAGEDDFEHDVAESYGPGIAMMVVAVALGRGAAGVDAARPGGTRLGAVVAGVDRAVLFRCAGCLRRPWTVVAETNGDLTGERPPERWMGTIRGLFAVRGEVTKIAKTIQQHALPDFDGPLHPME